MKSKIAIKLTLYFSVVLIIFSMIVGVVFFSVFSSHTTKVYKQDMEKTAQRVSDTMSGFYSGTSLVEGHKQGQGHGQGEAGRGQGFGAYLKYINDVSISNVWIVDKKSKEITCSMSVSYNELPQQAVDILSDCFNGKTVTSENFSSVLDDRTITVGVPIILADKNEIVGVVLLHSSVSGITEPIYNAFLIFGVVILIALIVVVLLAIILSKRFTKPILKINKTALVLAKGDYTSKTEVVEKNEIGQLAVTVDMLSQRLFDASQESKKLEQLRRDFVSNISHELRTPVTVIRGSLEAVKDGVAQGAKKDEYILAAHSESMQLERLVNDLLELSRLQNTDFDIEMSPLNVCDVISDVARSMRQIANKKNITLELESDVKNYIFTGDYGRLRQMIMIVVDNAIKFSPDNGTIKIIFKNGKLSVEDNGSGISPEELPHIFDRFHKAQESNKSGTGLGLTIAKQIANRHGIEISVTSELGVKTLFMICFDN